MDEIHQRRDELFDRLAVVGKAFGSARRLQLVELLAQGERGVDELAQAAGMGMTTVSAHLQVLRASDLVATRRQGTKVLYRLAGDDVAALYASMRALALERSADVARAREAYFDLPGDSAVDTLTRDEVLALLEHGDALVIDVRPPEEYGAGHIPGARSVPLETLEGVVPELGGAARVVAYCRGSYCVMAHDAVRLLTGHGVAATRLEDGMLEWRAAGLPVEAA